MWELPFSRALMYYHCALDANGVWTVPVDGKLSESSEMVLDFVRGLKRVDDVEFFENE